MATTPAKKSTARKTAAKKAAPAAKRVITKRPVSQTTDAEDTAEAVHQALADAPKISLEQEARAARGEVEPTEEEKITVVVPKGYTLTPQQGQTIDYGPGTQEMPVSHANHWWSRANGVKIYTK